MEDNDGDARLLLSYLEHKRFEVKRVTRLTDALGLLASGSFAVVLLDLNLPDTRGAPTLTRALQAAPGTPIVVLTGLDDEDLAVRAVQLGAQDYLVKGQIDARALTRTLRYAMERKRMILELDAAREREHHLATHDALTGLPNRALFFDRLSTAVEYAERYRHGLAVLYLDLDGFKQINDTHGHTAADGVLRTFAKHLVDTVRRSDTVARLGGDEFGVLLSRIRHPDDAKHVSRKLLGGLDRPLSVGDGETLLGASIGIAVYPGDGADPETLIRNADAAMYSAKHQGKGCYWFYVGEPVAARSAQ